MSAVSDGQIQPAMRAVQEKVSGSSFYLAMRLMPKPERDAMFAIYAFCRAVDDIADDGIGTRADRHLALQQWRSGLAALYRGERTEQTDFLVEPVSRFKLRLEDFETVIDGMEMDVAKDIFGPSLQELDLYCERVASAVGRLSIKVFGMAEEPGFELAHHLGRALQLTNILRDLDEDADIGRLYLPSEYLDAAAIPASDPRQAILRPEIDQVCRKVAAIAHQHYEKAERIFVARPQGRLRTPRLMGAVYSEILREMEKAGWHAPRHRVSLSKSTLLRIALASGLRG